MPRFPVPTLVLLVVLLVAVRARAADPPPIDTGPITRGVKEIAAPGVPGPLVVFGGSAAVVAVGREHRSSVAPVVAAATLGSGRIVAFGHTGYLDAPALDHGDTGVLMVNAARWAGGGQGREPRIAVLGNEAFAGALGARGLAATSIGADRLADLSGFDVLCAGAHGLTTPEQRAAVLVFVRRGGGLLTAGLGWGWLQLNPGRNIREHPGNLLLAEAGLAWADGTLDRTADKGFALGDAGSIPVECHALAALAAIERMASGQAAAPQQAAATLAAAVRTVPRDHEILRRCRAMLAANEASLAPGPESPLRADRAERALIAFQVEVERELPADQVRPHPAAAAFPGAVAADAPRVTRRIAFRPVRGAWLGTGLYAAPGEIVTVSWPAGSARVPASVRIGCHTDHLWHLDTWRRIPDISRTFEVRGDSARIASPYGGLIYIEGRMLARADAPPPELEFAGAVEAPRFILGATTAEQWEQSRAAPAPWAELESAKVIVTVPSEFVRDLADPAALMTFWDRISDAHATLATIPLDPPRPHRFVADVQISAGYMHSGYPIMTHLDAAEAMTSLHQLRRGSWGLLHELGHNHQVGDWTFEGTGEVTCNLFALHAVDTICDLRGESRGHRAVDAPPSVAGYIARGAKFDEWKRDPFLALQMYIQLERGFGWETYKKVFAEYRALGPAERPKNDDQKRDQWMARFSRACGHNLGPFFEAWGVPTSEGARESVADLPVWMPEELGAGPDGPPGDPAAASAPR